MLSTHTTKGSAAAPHERVDNTMTAETYPNITEGRRHPTGAALHLKGAVAESSARETRIVANATFAHACSLQISDAKGWRWRQKEGIKIPFRRPTSQ
jgi:hypothetical protein